MSNFNKSDAGTYKLKMNLMVQNLLLTSLGTCKFVLFHEKHPLAQGIKQFKLIDEKHLDDFIVRIKNTVTGKTLILSLTDELLIYTALDITCKVYLTDLGDKMASLNAQKLESSKTSFEDIRATILKGCEIVIEGMKETFTGIPAFDDRVDILENYILV